MFWPFNSRRKQEDRRERDIMRDLRVLESQHALLEAATQTADAANIVTNSLRSRLQDSINQFESTARILNDALVICDLSGKVQAFNPAAERMFGIPARDARDAFIGDLLISDSHPLDGENIWEVLAEIDQLDDDKKGLSGQARDGRIFPIDVNHTRLDRSDSTSIVLLVIRDVTPCEELKASLKSYRSIFDSTFDCILVIDEDDIVAANPIAADFFGYTVDQLLNKNLHDLVVTGGVNLANAVMSGDDAVDLKGRVTAHNGQHVEVFFTTTTIFWNGHPASLVTIKDTTRMWDHKPEIVNMICCFNEKFRITFANAPFAQFYGLKREKMIGMDIRTLLPDADRRAFLMHISSLTPEKPSRRMQLQTKTLEGETSLQVWTDHANFDEDGVEYQRIGRDITGTIRA